MYCARCYSKISKENMIMAVLPKGTVLVPTCKDDRLCIDRRTMCRCRVQVKGIVARVRELARRFVF